MAKAGLGTHTSISTLSSQVFQIIKWSTHLEGTFVFLFIYGLVTQVSSITIMELGKRLGEKTSLAGIQNLMSILGYLRLGTYV